jgi:hypothetical protein
MIMCSRQHSNRLWRVPVTARLAAFHHSVASYPPSAEGEFGDKLEDLVGCRHTLGKKALTAGIMDQLKMFESLSKT